MEKLESLRNKEKDDWIRGSVMNWGTRGLVVDCKCEFKEKDRMKKKIETERKERMKVERKEGSDESTSKDENLKERKKEKRTNERRKENA